MIEAFFDALVKAAERDERIVLIVGDLGHGVVEEFERRFPQRFFNVGILEQTMMGLAAGLALEGKKVFVYSIGPFASIRCLEQLRNDICHLDLDVKIIAAGAGLEYGTLGFSHFATDDAACVSAIGMDVFSPASKGEAALVAKKVLASSRPAYIRLNKEGSCLLHGHKGFFYQARRGSSAAIICSGRIIDEAIKARSILFEKGISLAVFSCCSTKIKAKKLKKVLEKFKYVFTLEEQWPIGGLGGVLNAKILKFQTRTQKVVNLGIKTPLCGLVGDRGFLLKSHRIDAISLAKTIKNVLKLKQKRENYGNKEGKVLKIGFRG